MVVGVEELIDQVLELGDGVGGWPGGQPFLHGLLEPFNLAGGGWMVRPSVFLGDPLFTETGLEGVAAASVTGEPGGVDHAVVGEH